MTVPAVAVAQRARFGPWIFGPAVDVGVFVLPIVLGFALVAAARALDLFDGRTLPEWGWVVLVLSVDVAHVWATVFRTYLDPVELRRRPLLYTALPLVSWAGGALLYARSSLLFWRVLAYVAVFHFIRQQVGWTAIYRARAGTRSLADRLIDEIPVYLGTGVPLLVWHTRLPRPFVWFMAGDFVDLSFASAIVPWAEAALALSLVVFVWHHVGRAARGLPLPLGKVAVVLGTALSWHFAIVVADDDLTFTALNVLPHGVPYFVLLYSYARARRATFPDALPSRIVASGVLPFLAVLLGFALLEEALWDRTVWHDRPWLFSFLPGIDAPAWHAILVPLLAVPQATHYLLDAVLWRRRDTGREQAQAMGFPTAP
jgi:hypothetical protein